MATACYWFDRLPFKDVWAQPRQWYWFALLVLACCALRLPFSGLSPVPGAIPFHPAAILWPFAVMALGPAAAFAWCAGEYLCDLWNGYPLWLRSARFIGHALAASWLIVHLRPRNRWHQNLLACTVAWTMVCAWHAAALEWAGWFPFVYIFPVAWLPFMTIYLLCSGLMQGARFIRCIETNRETWSRARSIRPAFIISPMLALVLLSIWLLVIVHFSGQWYGQKLGAYTHIGSPTGWKIAVPLVPLLLTSCLVVLAGYWPVHSRPR